MSYVALFKQVISISRDSLRPTFAAGQRFLVLCVNYWMSVSGNHPPLEVLLYEILSSKCVFPLVPWKTFPNFCETSYQNQIEITTLRITDLLTAYTESSVVVAAIGTKLVQFISDCAVQLLTCKFKTLLYE